MPKHKEAFKNVLSSTGYKTITEYIMQLYDLAEKSLSPKIETTEILFNVEDKVQRISHSTGDCKLGKIYTIKEV